MSKASKYVEKIYDISKVTQNRGSYHPLRFMQNGKEETFDYDVDEYCKILEDEARYAPPGTDTQRALLAEIYLALIDDEDEDEGYEEDDEQARKYDEKHYKKINRYNRRLIEGHDNRRKDGSKNGNVASDKMCYDFLLDLEKKKKISLLTRVKPDVPFYYENKYLYDLLTQLIDVMYTSEIYNYIPNSHNFQHICYKNHLEMIEKNIEEIFATRTDFREKWKLILKPLKRLIFNFNYPGFHEDDIWIQKCAELRFFDASYEIAKNYKLYQRIKKSLPFDLGDTEEEVKAEVEKSQVFLNKNRQDEKTLFCSKMIETLKIIVKDEFGLEIKPIGKER